MDPKVLENAMNIMNNASPFGIVKTIFQEFKKCVEMLNNILLEQGLFIRNVIHVGFETSIYYIIGDVCEDLFSESTCKNQK